MHKDWSVYAACGGLALYYGIAAYFVARIPVSRAWWYPGTLGPMRNHAFRVIVMDKPTGAISCTGWFFDPARARDWAEVCASTPDRRIGLVRMERKFWGVRKWTLVESWVSR